MDPKNETLADDKLRGVVEISTFIDEPKGRTYYLLENGIVPAGKIGRSWIASKAVLRAHYRRITNADPPPAERLEERSANGLASPHRGRPRRKAAGI
jgi:hypothetical protein